jgi:hypothetical protein
MFDVAEARLNKAVRTLPADQRLYLMRREPLDIEPSAKLLVESIDFRTACSFVNSYHSHHGSPVGHVFSLGVNAGEDLVAVAIVGRPNARLLDDGRTLEITLRAAGFTDKGVTGGGKWCRADRPREYEKNTGAKRRWRG